MSGVWMSSLMGNYEIGNKLGLRAKFFDEDWEPASFVVPPMSDAMHANMNRSARGYALRRDEMPEAAAIWNVKSFKKVHEIFWAGGFVVVRPQLAEILSRFDLGEGGLVPFPIYQSDLKTPFGEEFFLINFGARKNSILPEQCEDATKFFVQKDTGMQLWHINDLKKGGAVVLSSAALNGADIWFEEAIHGKIFMSDALACALKEARLSENWDLLPCQIMEEEK